MVEENIEFWHLKISFVNINDARFAAWSEKKLLEAVFRRVGQAFLAKCKKKDFISEFENNLKGAYSFYNNLSCKFDVLSITLTTQI